jgi:hypothetical protein
LKRVLIIAYYWPPSAGSGVQRWLKFVKYLPQFNWQPVVYTPDSPDFDIQDESLKKDIPEEAEILKTKIWEPYSIHKQLLGNGSSEKGSTAGIVKNSKSSISAKVANWIRGNFFIPDPKIFWVKPSVKYLRSYLAKNPVDIIISTGTPHSMHLIAKEIAKEYKLPWIADFRDPWSKLDMLKSYNISKSNFKRYERLEKSVLSNADLCVTTSNIWKQDFLDLGAKKAVCITNGFDESDFNIDVEPYEKFVISHFGLLNHLRNPSLFWRALSELGQENESFNKDLRIHLGGSISHENISEIESYPNLKSKLKVFEYLSHQEVVKEYRKSSLLLLLLFNSKSGIGNIPGKLFEYIASNKPIIGFGPGDGDSKNIILESKTGSYFNYSDTEINSIKNVILFQYNKSKESKIKIKSNKYSRKKLTEDLVEKMNDLIKK